MNPGERAKDEMECQDCRAGLLDKATHHVLPTREDPVTKLNASGLKSDVVTKDLTTSNQMQGQQLPGKWTQTSQDNMPPVCSENESPTMQVGNYALPVPKVQEQLESYDLTQFQRDKLKNLQIEDDFCKLIFRYLEDNELPAETKLAKRISILVEQFVIKEGIMYHLEIPAVGVAREVFQGVQLFLPQALWNNVVLEVHQQLHQALDKMVMQLKLQYWWPQMMRDVQRCIENCSTWQADCRLRNPYRPTLRSPKVPNSAGEAGQ